MAERADFDPQAKGRRVDVAQLLDTIPVPERVRQTLVDGAGPFQPYRDVVKAAESESLFDFREAADRLMMGVGEINRAQLRAAMAAHSLE